mgnify:CR=1 FL=1
MSDGQKSYEVRRVSIVPVSVIELTVFLSHPYADFYFKTIAIQTGQVDYNIQTV